MLLFFQIKVQKELLSTPMLSMQEHKWLQQIFYFVLLMDALSFSNIHPEDWALGSL